MFFIAPQPQEQPTSAPTTSGSIVTTKRKRLLPAEKQDSERISSYYSKRVARACDRCRLKKTKCSGGKICERCKQDGVVCVTTSNLRKNVSVQSSDYVQLVESQRDQLVQALHKVLQNNEPTNSAKVEAVLADMGISIDNVRQIRNMSTDTSSVGTDEPDLMTWDEIFDNLDDPQLQAIESLCATVPQAPLPPDEELEVSMFQSGNCHRSDNFSVGIDNDAVYDSFEDTFNENEAQFGDLQWFLDADGNDMTNSATIVPLGKATALTNVTKGHDSI